MYGEEVFFSSCLVGKGEYPFNEIISYKKKGGIIQMMAYLIDVEQNTRHVMVLSRVQLHGGLQDICWLCYE